MKHREDVRQIDGHDVAVVPAGPQLPTVILQLDREGYVTASTSEVFGRRLSDLIGIRLCVLLTKAASGRFDRAMRAAAEGGVYRLTVRCRGQRNRHRLFVTRSDGAADAEPTYSVIVSPGVPGPLAAVPKPAGTAPPRRRLLIAEDEPILLQLSTRVLNQAGFETTSATDGNAVLDALTTRNDIGLVILDLSLPGPTAPDLLRQVRALEAAPRILLVTGRPLEEVAELLTDEPTLEHLQKPYSNDLLIDMVNRLLDS